MLIEVAETSLLRDREKASIYARAGIPIYWIVNLVQAYVEVYAQPVEDRERRPAYAQSTVREMGDDIPFVLDGVELGSIPAAELLS